MDVNPRTFVVTLNATTDSTPVNVVLTNGQLARLTDSAHSHYVHYIENPADGASTVGTITTNADLLDADGEPIDATSTITPDDNGFQQIAVNPDADGRFIITFDTATAVGTTLNDANAALQTALAAFVDDPDTDNELADTIETEAETANAIIADRESTTTQINTALEAFRTAVTAHDALSGLTNTIDDLRAVGVIDNNVPFNDADTDDNVADTQKRRLQVYRRDC